MAKQNKKPNQDRIEKLQWLKADKESQAIADRMIDEARNGRAFPLDIVTQAPTVNQINVKAIIKLNEELTAENSRLLEELDKANEIKLKTSILADFAEKRLETILELEKKIKLSDAHYDRLMKEHTTALFDLQSIKSKWWYKLMTWGWN